MYIRHGDFAVLGWFYDKKEEEEEIVVYTGERERGGKGEMLRGS